MRSVKDLEVGDLLELSNGEVEAIKFISHESFLQLNGEWSKGSYIQTDSYTGTVVEIPEPEQLTIRRIAST